MNVLILKLYKRNTDLQMDTQQYYRIANALVSALSNIFYANGPMEAKF